MTKLSAIFAATVVAAVCLWFYTPGYTVSAPAAPQRPVEDVKSTIRRDGNKISVERTGGPGRVEFVPGEVLVKLKNSAVAEEAVSESKTAQGAVRLSSDPGLTAVFERFGVNQARKPFASFKSAAHGRVVKLISPSLKDDPERTKALASELQREPGVEYAELNLIMRVQAAPNDPYYSSSGAWGQSFRDLWGLQKINAEAAWNTTRGNNVVVAVIDTGVDYGHEDIAANVKLNAGETGNDGLGNDRKSNGVDDDGNGFVDDWRGWDFVTIDGTPEDNDPMDDHGHGTHVGGTIGAIGNNGLGVVGVAPAAKVMPLKGLNEFGSGTTEDLAKAILYAADNGARVINASWGGFSFAPVHTFIDAIDYAHDTKGVVFVAAAGNNNSDVGGQERGFAPANIRDVITVSAFDHTDAKANFSNFGLKIDVAAPGGGDEDATGSVVQPARSILSLSSSQAGPDMTGSGELIVGAKYLRQAGTSMASPHVAGVAALIRARHPAYSPEQVRQALRLGSDDVGDPGFDPNAGHGRINAAKSLTVASPLAVQLTEPNGTLVGLTEASVRGTVAGSGLANWRLEYGPGNSPSAWTQIASSSAPVSEGQLALWDLTPLPDGIYTLRLVAQNTSGKTFEDKLPVRLDNVLITEPAYDIFSSAQIAFFRAGQVISVKGTVTPQNFSSYTIDVLDSGDNVLGGAKITLTGGGLQKIRDGVLGTWNTAGVPTDSYTIRLNVNLTNGSSIQEITRVIVDSAIHTGWPRNLGLISEGFGALSFTDHLDAQDINGDGAKDLIVGYGKTVRIFNHTGALLPGWPRSVDSADPRATVQQSPAVGDLTGDGSPEIVAANNFSEVFVWAANGTPLPGWPKYLGGSLNALAVNDINNDGVNEIIATDWQGNVKVFDKDGESLPGWPQYLGFDILLPASIADLDGDGQKELVVATSSNQTELYVFRSNGTVVPGWPKLINSWAPSNYGFLSYPALGDLNGDGDLEIVIGAGNGKVHAFHHTGSVVSGWPRSTKATPVNSPAVGDIDGDGKAEVVAGNHGVFENNRLVNYLYAWRGNGTPLTGWPVKAEIYGYRTSSFFGFGAPVIADVDGDGVPDIVASSDGANFIALRAYKADGSEVAGFPKAVFDVGGWAANTVAVADLDNDGLLEMAWIDASANAYVWDLPSPAFAPAPWPMFHRDARHSGAAPTGVSVSISGQVSLGAGGLGGVKMTLTSTAPDFAPRTVNTTADGNYSFTDLPRGATYTLKPAKLGYVFTPPTRTYSNVTASKTGVNFAAAAAKFSIEGKVAAGTTGLGGVTMTLSGSRAATTTSLGDGSFKFAELPAGGSYTVKPAKAGYSFTPASKSYTELTANKTDAVFAASPVFTIGGQVKLGTSGVANVAMTLTSPSPAGFTPRRVFTTGTGAYAFTNLPAGRNYVVTPSSKIYNFTPASRSYTNLSANKTAENYTSARKLYTIRGRVTQAGTTTGIGAVTITLTNSSGATVKTVTTQSDGTYTLSNVQAGFNYVIRPTKTGYTFSPTTRSITNLSSSISVGPSTSFTGTQ